MSFEDAKNNFYNAARVPGLNGQMRGAGWKKPYQQRYMTSYCREGKVAGL